MSESPMQCALISVSDKTGVVEIARRLHQHGLVLLSTGGTATVLRDAGLPVTDIASHTGAAEMMAGRVKTLHPTVHGGILGRRGVDDDVMQSRDIAPIDYVVVNLYPFEATVANPDVQFDDAIENIDIGGPAMVRSSAKNHAHVAVVTSPDQYADVMASLDQSPEQQEALRFQLAVEAFQHTARYDGMIANYLGTLAASGKAAPPACFPQTLNHQFVHKQALRYGENPHQRAAFYSAHDALPGSLAASKLMQGKALSYNNVMDADAALACVRQFNDQPACVIVKHGNPCGVAVADSLERAYDRAFLTDATSAFGGIIAFNRPLDKATATAIVERQFVEVIIAPGIETDALTATAEFANVRVLDCDNTDELAPSWQLRPVSGGLLVQDDDVHVLSHDELSVVSKRQPTQAEIDDLMFAWRVAKFVKSNAIVYCRDKATVGVGAGQMSRVYSARIAAIKAADEHLEVKGSVMASDAFFPFRDGIDQAAEVGIRAVVQPGGSRNDGDVIAAADEHDMAMVFTGIRHFRH